MSTQKCSFWQALSAASCCFYRSSCVQVQFTTKERCLMEGSSEKLRKELEEELKLGSDDIRSHAWYHGCLPREVAERAMGNDGDFLIRDSVSSPGNFVLTCRWGGAPLHFKIHRELLASVAPISTSRASPLVTGRSRVQYRFEQECFDSVPALVRFHVGNRRPISAQTGAVVARPVNRTVPLRYLEARYGGGGGAGEGAARGRALGGSPAPQGGHAQHPLAKRLSLNMGDAAGQDGSSASLVRAKEKSGSHPTNLDHLQEKHRHLHTHQSESHLPLGQRGRAAGGAGSDKTPALLSPLFRTGSEPVLSPTFQRRVGPDGAALPSAFDGAPPASSSSCYSFSAAAAGARSGLRGSDGQLNGKPPPKPCRAPSVIIGADLEATGGHYCELRPIPLSVAGTPASRKRGHVERLVAEEVAAAREAARRSETNFSVLEGERTNARVTRLADGKKADEELFVPEVETESAFQPGAFRSPLLPADNKPLDTAVLRLVKETFGGHDARTIAGHITAIDCQVARVVGVTEERRRRMGVSSGLELLTLPHGHQLRLDLMERFHTLAIGIAVDVLGCTGNLRDRAALLHKTVQLAVELRSSFGNLFGFAAVMRALDLPQVTRLEQTWAALRQQHTESAIAYEKKLKPFLKSLNEGKEGLPLSNTTIPHIVPLLQLLEKPCGGLALDGPPEPWEGPDHGLEAVLRHLENGRSVAANARIYSTNADAKLAGAVRDERLLDVFRTEFMLKLLWGSKGAEVAQSERYDKFEQILNVLSKRLEPPVKQSEL
ncbi:breast cancer anti-estrogen resistance protein 3-like isoform X1 [Lampetra fluviatilis]